MWENISENLPPDIDDQILLRKETSEQNTYLQISNFLDGEKNKEELATFFAENLLPDAQNIMYS